jgi:hypothetical protein
MRILLLPCAFQAANISYLVVEGAVENSAGTGTGPETMVGFDFVAVEIAAESGSPIGFDFVAAETAAEWESPIGLDPAPESDIEVGPVAAEADTAAAEADTAAAEWDTAAAEIAADFAGADTAAAGIAVDFVVADTAAAVEIAVVDWAAPDTVEG